ncbi:MAG: isochorismate synthase [Planctomycetota bacterium]|nr:MAG: isochorismate synthase [Planctomycetota bacterium]
MDTARQRQQVAAQACQLADLRRCRCFAVLAEPWRLDAKPGPLLASLPRPRHLFWQGARWLVIQGAAGRLQVSGPGRATRLAAAFAKLGERCCCAGDFPRGLPLATLAFSFEDQSPGPGAWGAQLPGAEAILPARAWWREGRRGWRISCCAVDPGENAQTVAARLAAEPQPEMVTDAGEHPWRNLSPEPFTDLVREAVSLVHHGALRKVVLARAVDMQLARVPEPSQLLAALGRFADRSTTVYWYDLPGQASFVGATPETLFSLEQGRLHTMALAGSRPRGRDAAQDRALAKELLSSTKERKEHNLVLEHLARVLEGRVGELHIPPSPALRRLGNVQHLQTDLEADLQASDPFDLLAQLHPTPAVCGLPCTLAADHIRRREGLQRGLYSGVLGWLTPQHCHFIVPLRGGILHQRRARLFAGAGIVESSDPEAEERETETKLGLMRQVLSP